MSEALFVGLDLGASRARAVAIDGAVREIAPPSWVLNPPDLSAPGDAEAPAPGTAYRS